MNCKNYLNIGESFKYENKYVALLSKLYLEETVSLEQIINVLRNIKKDNNIAGREIFLCNALIHLRNKIYNVERYGKWFSMDKLDMNELNQMGQILELIFSFNDKGRMKRLSEVYSVLIQGFINFCLTNPKYLIYCYKYIIKPILENGMDELVYQFMVDGVFSMSDDAESHRKFGWLIDDIFKALGDNSDTLYKDTFIPMYFDPNGFIIGYRGDTDVILEKVMDDNNPLECDSVLCAMKSDDDKETYLETIRSISGGWNRDYSIAFNMSSLPISDWDLMARLSMLPLHMLGDYIYHLNLDAHVGMYLNALFRNQEFRANFIPEVIFTVLHQMIIPVEFIGIESDLYLFSHKEFATDKNEYKTLYDDYRTQMIAGIKEVLLNGKGLNEIGYPNSN